MYKKILVPVDLAHADKLQRALDVSSDLAKHYGASICYVGVTTALPSGVAHSEAEFAQKLERFAAEQGAKHGLSVETKVAESHDPVRDLDDVLGKVIKDHGADLVVMASHVPTFWDHVFSSNAGYLAAHTTVSVFIVR
ncbi:universal stress protein [Chelativorans sp. M5D2P16]|uniref:universal stress protein n=1 Tax=Chelativorans sp. M5D2P16 TaxID=3095678 RepID=UPI002AC9FACD|nr:universal stress protein [Chelativorans sp. M5D2P16]MDZ5696420.1 universal stress protein [Chelativorans sp. M5D2P16]